MKPVQLFTLVLPFTVLVVGCVTTSTTSTTWTAEPPMAAQEWARPGRVGWIREVVHRQEGNPVGGAVAGAIIGGMLGGHGPAAVVGAVGGAAIGAAASQGGARVVPTRSSSGTTTVAIRCSSGEATVPPAGRGGRHDPARSHPHVVGTKVAARVPVS